jgi:hypothetical protein
MTCFTELAGFKGSCCISLEEQEAEQLEQSCVHSLFSCIQTPFLRQDILCAVPCRTEQRNYIDILYIEIHFNARGFLIFCVFSEIILEKMKTPHNISRKNHLKK